MENRIKYSVWDPTGNITALVESVVPIENQPSVAERIMKTEPKVEQVGFIRMGSDLTTEEAEVCDIALRMAGGEFCGNATMSSAVYCFTARGLTEGVTLRVSVSGCEEPVSVAVLPGKTEAEGMLGTVRMPKPGYIGTGEFRMGEGRFTLPMVDFGSILHLIVLREEKNSLLFDKSYAEKAVKQWCTTTGCPGMGLMMVDSDGQHVNPLVYCQSPETLFWESSCASGTTALGAYLAHASAGSINQSFLEPGGELKVRADSDGRVLLTGHVRFVSKGEILENRY